MWNALIDSVYSLLLASTGQIYINENVILKYNTAGN